MPPKNNLREKVHKRLRLRVIMYFVISIIVICISIYHIVKDNANILFSFIGLVLGTIVGIFVSRMYKISWDENAGHVISTFDAVGIIVLILYIVFDIFRERIVEHFINGPSVVAVSFAVLAGVMYGRVIGIRGKIRTIFIEEGII